MTEVDVAKLRDRDVLWQALDWTFWGVGMGDTFRESLADKMIATLTVEEFEKAQVLIRQWNDYRGGPHERNLFIEIKAERDAAIARAERAEAAIERVRALHKPVMKHFIAWCPTCNVIVESEECQTVLALAALDTRKEKNA